MNADQLKDIATSNHHLAHLFQNGMAPPMLSRCAEAVAGTETLTDDQKVHGFSKLCDATAHGIKIFVSYKLCQPQAAVALLEPFKLYGAGRIRHADGWPFLAERSDAGKDYRDAILKALEETHWFFLIVPDEKVDRTWTLFEAGYFRRGMNHFTDRLICIHHPSVSIDGGPLSSFQACQATPDRLAELLDQLLNDDEPVPGAPAVHGGIPSEILHQHAKKIADLIVPVREIRRVYLAPYIDLSVNETFESSSDVQLMQMTVESADGIDGVFGHSGIVRNVTFRDIVSDLNEQEFIYWIEDLKSAIARASRGRTKQASCPSFQGVDGKLYRPHVHALRRFTDTDEVASVHVIFTEVFTGPIRSAPDQLQALAIALRLGFAFRWELLEERVVSPRDVEVIDNRLRTIELEAMQQGLALPPDKDPDDLSDSLLVSAFDEASRPEMTKLYAAWRQFRSPDGSGLLDKALAARDPGRTRECLGKLRPLNSSFMRMGSARYAELVATHWSEREG